MSESEHPAPDQKPDEHVTSPHVHGHSPDHGHDDAGPNVSTYFKIFGVLMAVTTVSFIANLLVRGGAISAQTSFVVILSVAVFKSTLVAMYFMHLLLDWKKVFIMIVPALVLGPMLVVVLLPDIVLAWHNVTTP